MLKDLDPILSRLALDAIIVPMHERMHASFRWLTCGAKVTRGYAVKLRDREPVLVTYPMEREEAAATGTAVRLAAEFEHDSIFRDAATPTEAYAQFFTNVLRVLGSGETIAFFGNAPLQIYIGLAEAMERYGWRVLRGLPDPIESARKRKDPWEIEAIRSVGGRTEQVVDGVRRLLQDDPSRLTLGDLKHFVTMEIHSLGMIEDHETILSQGRDAGIPHSRGDASAAFRPSVPIVLDIFPADAASGYFFDLTRTFCVGPIPDELRRIHADVLEAFVMARDAVRPGTPASSYQAMVCDFFESRGHPTQRTNPGALSGYIHGLGHGVGLDIHEKPSFSLLPSNGDSIEVGDVITIEPGLYFPDREIGVRIEDTFVVTERGAESLCRGGYGLEP